MELYGTAFELFLLIVALLVLIIAKLLFCRETPRGKAPR